MIEKPGHSAAGLLCVIALLAGCEQENDMTVYAIAQSRVTDQAQLNAYVAASSPTLAAHGGRVIAFDETPVAVEGDIDYSRTVIVAFNSEAEFYRWYDSPEYRAARELRKDAAVGRFILVQGLPGD